jgi:N-acyl-D-aspartate/D-glutamate deacylase
MLSTFDYAVALLAFAREREALSLEEVVRLLTGVPAALYGIPDRGRVVDGAHADLVVFDPATVGPGRVSWRNDLPGGAGRLFSQPSGIESVFVNGTEIVAGGELTGERAGQLLRPGAAGPIM